MKLLLRNVCDNDAATTPLSAIGIYIKMERTATIMAARIFFAAASTLKGVFVVLHTLQTVHLI